MTWDIEGPEKGRDHTEKWVCVCNQGWLQLDWDYGIRSERDLSAASRGYNSSTARLGSVP